jgi:hypothetical protein
MNNVKPNRNKDKNMKKSILATMTAAALLASAPFANANAFLELISGGNSVIVTPGNLGPNSVGYIGSIGSWSLDIATGSSSGSLVVGLQNQSINAPSQTSGLEVIYSSGGYSQTGTGYWGIGTSGIQTLGTVASVYRSASLYSGVGSLGTLLGPALTAPAGAASSSSEDVGAVSGTYYITEELLIGNPAPNSIHEFVYSEVNATFTVVPDGGLTVALLGCVFIGLAGIRSKLGKRA